MKLRLLLLLAAASGFAACGSNMNDPETTDATLPSTAAPSAMIGAWASKQPAQTATVYKGTPSERKTEYVRFTDDGRNAVLFDRLPASGESARFTGTIRFASESINSHGSFRFLALKGETVSAGGNNREVSAADLKMISAKTYAYRMDGEWLRIDTGGEPTDASRTFKKEDRDL